MVDVSWNVLSRRAMIEDNKKGRYRNKTYASETEISGGKNF
jgi:hypothetical protein